MSNFFYYTASKIFFTFQEDTNVPFREKTAYVMTAILVVGALFYFNKVISLSQAIGETAPPVLGFVIAYVILIVIVSIIAMSALGIAAPKEANAPADEREQRILDKAGHWSGYVLATGVFAGLLHYSVTLDGNLMFHILFGSLMASQIAEYVLQIMLYRRGV